jgi:TPR repeat protein
MYAFGMYNAMGRGVPKNQPLGVDWLKKAARRGHPDAQKTLQNNNISWEG